MIEMIARTKFTYNKRVIRAGEHFTAVSERDAHTLSLIGRAKYTEDKKRAYRRRDMQAQ